MFRLFFMFSVFLVSHPALAHLGHVGEVAGHAHWIGLGAVIVAGALAAAIGKLSEKDGENIRDDENGCQEEPEDATPEAPVKG